ncbi:hypothetical protein [Erwinia psidii]|uniref:hypothetical protein n=1 Tax=Erwinia psidii TaxID=69224 RepID=UPI0018F4025E|nr:hypothetical protein [Erwinia psidii]
MPDLSRRSFMVAGTVLAGAISGAGLARDARAANQTGFMAASQQGKPTKGVNRGPGIQCIYALCEVTGGGEKIYGIAASILPA